METRGTLALSHLKMRHLMLIDLLVQHGTLHKAARMLSISQPAATSMLNDLEALLGIRLFQRSRRGVEATAATRSLLDKMQPVLAGFDDLIESVQRISSGRPLSLRVGVVPQAFVAYLPAAIEQFCGIDGYALQAHEGTATHLLSQLLNGALDCVVGRIPTEGLPDGISAKSLGVRPLYREGVCIVARRGHAILDVASPGLERLARERWVLQQRDSSVRRAFVEAFVRQGLLPPDPLVETGTYLQNLAIVAQSDLLSVVPRQPAEQYRTFGQVEIVDLRLDVAPSQVSLITRLPLQGNTLVERFAQALELSLKKGNAGRGETDASAPRSRRKASKQSRSAQLNLNDRAAVSGGGSDPPSPKRSS